MLYGLDLFSGIGGITEALSEWVRPVAYCERDRFAQGVLLSRMAKGQLPTAPIWDDATTLRGAMLPAGIDIIYGGSPCQDISVAGKRVGLDGERSGLIREVWRLADEIRPRFIFLENVPAIVNGGLDQVLSALAERGYDARWLCLSAAEMGACHLRNRWWLLAYTTSESAREWRQSPLAAALSTVQTRTGDDGQSRNATDATSEREQGGELQPRTALQPSVSPSVRANSNELAVIAHANRTRLEGWDGAELRECAGEWTARPSSPHPTHPDSLQRLTPREPRNGRAGTGRSLGWPTVAPICGTDAQVPNRSHRISALGNSVDVPTAREAFRRLSGL